jgi:hypothetical protein
MYSSELEFYAKDQCGPYQHDIEYNVVRINHDQFGRVVDQLQGIAQAIMANVSEQEFFLTRVSDQLG